MNHSQTWRQKKAQQVITSIFVLFNVFYRELLIPCQLAGWVFRFEVFGFFCLGGEGGEEGSSGVIF